MITKFLQFTNSKLKAVDKQIFLQLITQVLLLVIKKTMVIHPENKTFTQEETQNN
jgi:hypothetical protein